MTETYRRLGAKPWQELSEQERDRIKKEYYEFSEEELVPYWYKFDGDGRAIAFNPTPLEDQ